MRVRNEKNRKGMTMVETLAAFTILIMLSLSFLAIIKFATTMTMDADDRRAMASELDERLARVTSEANGFKKKVAAGSLVLKNETDGEYVLSNCEAYLLDHPTTGPEVTVIRFEYKE